LIALFGFHCTFCVLARRIFSLSGNNRKTEIAAFVSDAPDPIPVNAANDDPRPTNDPL
jgi:hypothetical protein